MGTSGDISVCPFPPAAPASPSVRDAGAVGDFFLAHLCPGVMQERLLAIQQSEMTHAARSLYAVYLAREEEDGVARGEDGTPLTQKRAAELIGTSASRASTYFGELVDAGWIEDTAIGPKPTCPEEDDNTCSESESYQSDSYQSDKNGYQSDNHTYQSDNSAVSPPSSPRSFSLSPFLSDSLYPSPLSSPHNTPLSEGVVEKISTTSQRGIPDWVPPGSYDLRTELPDDHPARSERHLRYRKAAEWSLELLLRAEGAIESFRVPSAVRRKADGDRLGLLQSWADVFRLLQEQDSFEWSEIRYAIHWLFTESDWLREGYIASVGSLRKKTSSGTQTKFESILTQAKADSSYDGPDQPAKVGDGPDRSDESLAERLKRNRRAARSAVAA
jgi:hypothetical protein